MPQTASLSCESHPDIAATRVVEFRILDPLSATGDEFFPPVYIGICAAQACEIAACAAARMSGADHRTVHAYDVTPAVLADITGLAVA